MGHEGNQVITLSRSIKIIGNIYGRLSSCFDAGTHFLVMALIMIQIQIEKFGQGLFPINKCCNDQLCISPMLKLCIVVTQWV